MDLKESLDQLIENLKQCPELQTYREAREELKKYPEKETRVQEYRQANYRVQNAGDEIDLFSEMDRLGETYQDVFQDPVMQNYLKAEAGLCKIVQTIDAAVVEALDFQPLSQDA